MKNDLKRFEIAGAQADCTVAALAGSFHPLAGAFFGGRRGGELGGDGGRDGGRERQPPRPPLPLSLFFFSGQWSFPVTAVLLSRGGGSSTGREAAWDRWTCPAPPPLSPPTTASLIKNRSPPLSMCLAGYASGGRD